MANVGLWVGIAGIIVSVFAVIILYLTRKNILDILDKDVILFDRNFEIKKSVLEQAFNVVDKLEQQPSLLNNADFKQQALSCYNSLLCVVSDLKVARAFYSIAIKGEKAISNIGFKLMCRADIGLANKRSSKTKNQAKTRVNQVETAPVQTPPPAEQPTKPAIETEPKLVNTNPSPSVTPAEQIPAEPVKPVQIIRPAQQENVTPAKRPGRPKKTK